MPVRFRPPAPAVPAPLPAQHARRLFIATGLLLCAVPRAVDVAVGALPRPAGAPDARRDGVGAARRIGGEIRQLQHRNHRSHGRTANPGVLLRLPGVLPWLLCWNCVNLLSSARRHCTAIQPGYSVSVMRHQTGVSRLPHRPVRWRGRQALVFLNWSERRLPPKIGVHADTRAQWRRRPRHSAATEEPNAEVQNLRVPGHPLQATRAHVVDASVIPRASAVCLPRL